jgi:hypothetical protein
MSICPCDIGYSIYEGKWLAQRFERFAFGGDAQPSFDLFCAAISAPVVQGVSVSIKARNWQMVPLVLCAQFCCKDGAIARQLV